MADHEDQTKEKLLDERNKLRRCTVEPGHPADSALYQDLFERLPDGAVIVDSDGRIVRVNARLERMFGYTRDEIISNPIEILVPERFAARHAEARKDYMFKPRRRLMGVGLELYGRRKDGSEFPVDIDLIPMDTGDAMVIAAVVRDYTWRKRGEEAAIHLAAIVESSADAIIGKTLDGAIFSWNAGAERIYGYSGEEARGRSFSVLIPPDRSHELPEFMERVKRGERIENYETIRVRKDGSQIHVSVTVSPIMDSTGRITGASTITRDITDRKRAEEEIRKVNEKLARLYEDCEATNKELEAFSYSVSHDLRTPLVAVGGLAGILLGKYASQIDDKGKGFLEAIFKETDRMRQLIDDLLAFSRSGRQGLQQSNIDMNELAAGVVEELKLLEPGRALRLNLKSLPPAHGDPVMIRQVMMNLVSNAMKFTQREGTAVIEIGGKAEDRASTYYIKDNGVGFDKADSGKLFKVFERLHPQEFEGTGIGLAIVWRIVQRHGGRVWAEGKVNEGATFYFSLPKP